MYYKLRNHPHRESNVMRLSSYFPKTVRNILPHRKNEKAQAKVESQLPNAPKMYIERDPARNLNTLPKRHVLEKDTAKSSEDFIKANNALSNALKASGLRPGVVGKIDLNKPLLLDLNEDKKQNKSLSASPYSDPIVSHLLMKATPQEVLGITTFPNKNNQEQTLILHGVGGDKAGVKAILRQKDGSSAILTHSQLVDVAGGKKPQNTMQVGQNGETLIQSFDSKKTYASSLNTPNDVLANILSNSHQSSDGRLLKVTENQLYQFNTELNQWDAIPEGKGAEKLLTTSGGSVYQIAAGKIKDTLTNKAIASSMPANSITDINRNGAMIGINSSVDSDTAPQILLGKINQTDFRRHSIDIPPNSEINDAIEVDGKIWLSVTHHDEHGNTVDSALYSAAITGELDEQANVSYQLSQPERVTVPYLGPELENDYSIEKFIHNDEGKIFVKLAGNDSTHIASFDTSLGKIGSSPSQKVASTWKLSGATVIENGKGLPQVKPSHEISLTNGTRLSVVNNSLYQKDLANDELHPTNLNKEVTSLATDNSGKQAYALVNGSLKELNVGSPRELFTMSNQPKTSLARSDATQVSVKKTLPGNNIATFAVADASLIVQQDNTHKLTAIVNGQIHEIPSLPGHTETLQLAFDKNCNLYALNDEGKLFKMPADSVVKPQQQGEQTNGETWQPLDLPDSSKILHISTGSQVKIELEGVRDKHYTLASPENDIKHFPPDTPTVFEDFSKRGRYGHIHEKKDKETGETSETLHNRQSIKTRTGNVMAHLRDVPVHSMKEAKSAFMKRLQGSTHTVEMAKEAKVTHREFNALSKQLNTNKDAPLAPMTQRINNLEAYAPETTKQMRALHQQLLTQLKETLTQAGLERDVINPKTGQVQMTNKHVGKEYGSKKDLINTLNKLMTQLNISDDNKVRTLLKAFHDNNQGLISHQAINPKQPHSQRSLQITKEHIELLSVKLAKLSDSIKETSEAMISADSPELHSAADARQAKKTKQQLTTYQNNLVAKENQKGVASYKQALDMESALENVLNYLDRPNSGLSRAMRSKVGAKNHEDTLAIMQQVAATIPENSELHLGERVGTHLGYAAWRLGLPQTQDKDNAIQLAAFTEVAAKLGSKSQMQLSVAANGDLHLNLSKIKDTGVSALTAGAISVGNGKALIQVGEADAKQDGRFKMLLRFQTWFEGAVNANHEKGGTLVIPADKKAGFINTMFGGHAASKIDELMNAASSQTKKEGFKVSSEIGGYIAAALRLYGDSDLSVGRDVQPYLRVQGEIDGRMKFAELGYQSMIESGRSDHHTEKTDQMLHLLPSGYIRARVAQYHTVNLQAGDSFVYGGTTGTAQNGGTGITENYDDVGNTPLEKRFFSFDNKREKKFDGTSRTASEITKADYTNAIQDLALAFKDSHPEFARKIVANLEVIENNDNDFKELAKPTVNTAVTLLAGAQTLQEQGENSTLPRLNNKQLATINVLAMVDIHKEAYDNSSRMQGNIQHTTAVTNFDRLHDEGTVNKLASKVGIGPKVNSTALLAQLMQHSPDLKTVIGNTSKVGSTAVLKVGFHPSIQKRIDELSAADELTEEILSGLLQGKGNLVKKIEGKYQIIPNAQAGKNNLVVLELDVSKSNMRERNFDTQTPFFRPGAQTSVGSAEKAMNIQFYYDDLNSHLPSSFAVQKHKNISVSDSIAIKMASDANLKISTAS